MRRFSIRSLMAIVVAAAIAVAALRNADDYWAGGLLLGTSLFIGVATVGAVYHSGPRRAGRLGFAVFAGGYFALAFLGLSDQNLGKLPTTWLLTFVHQRVVPPQTFVYTLTPTASPGGGQSTFVVSGFNPQGNNLVGTAPPQPPIQAATKRWARLLPGAANLEAFSIVGHCLFAVVSGLLGMVIARRYQARQERALEADQEMAAG